MRFAFLDMDGVLVDFVGGACKAHNRPSPYTSRSALGIFEIETLWKITPDEFWKPCNTKEFWLELEKTPEADEIVQFVTKEFGVENTALLTTPSEDPQCVPAKKEWIRRYYPQFQEQMIFTKTKQFLAGDDRYLFDDRDKNIEGFIKAGGQGIIIPRLWNSRHSFHTSVMADVRAGYKAARTLNTQNLWRKYA